jgi:hypothetical protein
MRRVLFAFVVAALLCVPTVASAHQHVIDTPNREEDTVLAHGQNHPPFIGGTSCESYGPGDPAGYGLETAHHGPDAGTPGKSDGCYQTTGNVPPGQDVQNPVITN